MKVIGLFKELLESEDLDSSKNQYIDYYRSVYRYKGKLPKEIKNKLLLFFAKAEPFIYWLSGCDYDPFTNKKIEDECPVAQNSCYYCADQWIWRGDLVYLVNKYDVGVPLLFMDYIRSVDLENIEIFNQEKIIDTAQKLDLDLNEHISRLTLEIYDKAIKGNLNLVAY